ncbi:hypothetical protein [Exiguobacterium qingdaonense]|uniref:hypothetical protein n=1 Tax=Exiguobacterium qingdaonense TaxID=2751251 RepID=UPI001BE8B005|nr:hypothetical protein [Exiguobacterium qingdaonense]
MEAVRLLQDAIRFQQALCETPLGKELITKASPVLWYGRPGPNQWLTIGTNPSRGEFLHRDGTPRTGEDQKFYWRNALSFEDYLGNEEALQDTIERASTYFESGRATTSWFGKSGGAKLEALLNGMGRSFYDEPASVVHVDFFKFATYEQMGKIKNGRDWLEHPTSIELLERTIGYIKPSRIIVLGRDNCRTFLGFSTRGQLATHPAITYEIGRHESGIPMIGLHMKPSEVFVGLGNGYDSNGLHYGSYAKREHLLEIGQAVEAIMDEWWADERA